MMNNKGEGSIGLTVIIFFAVMLALLTFLGVPFKISIAVLAVCIVFFISIVNTDLALIILIFTMLLSPEFASGSTAGRSVKIRADDIFIMVIFCGWLAKMAINKELGLFRATKLNTPIMFYMLICVFAAFLGIVAGRTNIKSAFFFVIKYIEYFLLFFMVSNNMKTLKQAKKFVFFLMLTCLLVCIYSQSQTMTGGRASAPFESGAGGEPNTLAGYLILMMSLAVAFIIYSDSPRQSMALFVLLGLAGNAFLLTLSRSGWISAFPAVFTLTIFMKKYRFQMIAAILTVAIALPIFAPNAVRLRVKETFVPWKEYRVMGSRLGVDESASARIDSWKKGVERWSNRPIFGYGIPCGAFIDNQYMRVLNESGIIGFAVFIWMLVTVFNVIRQAYFESGQDNFKRAVSLGLLAGFMGLIVLSSSAAVFVLIRIMEPFWFLMAIVTTLPELSSADGESATIG